MKKESCAAWVSTITTVIFDIDDTLYPASCGFSGHRNGPIVAKFMVDELGFSSEKEALALRDDYFRRYHSTLKGLSVASSEGKLRNEFRQESLGEYWAKNCEFEKFLKRDDGFVADFESLPKRKIAFTNAPRAYGIRCLESLGLLSSCDDVFGVEDVMPSCKPEPAAFEKVLGGTDPSKCLMVEDSMKNVRACHALGIRTVLVKEPSLESQSEAALLGDQAEDDDPAVDVVISKVQDLRKALPGLWE